MEQSNSIIKVESSGSDEYNIYDNASNECMFLNDSDKINSELIVDIRDEILEEDFNEEPVQPEMDNVRNQFEFLKGLDQSDLISHHKSQKQYKPRYELNCPKCSHHIFMYQPNPDEAL